MKKIFHALKKYPFMYILRRIYEEAWQRCVTFISSMLFHVKCFLAGCECGKNIEIYGKVIIRSAWGG